MIGHLCDLCATDAKHRVPLSHTDIVLELCGDCLRDIAVYMNQLAKHKQA